MATGTPHFFDASRFISSTGGVTGGSVYFYYTGTTNLAPVYTDLALTTPATNPVMVANGAILPNLYLDPAVKYRRRIVFLDSSIQDEDPIATTGVSAADLSAEAGAGLVGYLQLTPYPEGTVGYKLNEFVSVKDFGAKGDGVTDDTAAINAARDSGVSRLIFPEGVYLTTGLVFNLTHNTTELVFHHGSKIKLISALNRVAVDVQKYFLDITGKLTIQSSGTTNDGFNTIGLRAGSPSFNPAYLTIEDVAVDPNFSKRGVQILGGVDMTIGNARVNAGSPAVSTAYGISFEVGNQNGSVLSIGKAYVTGGIRGFYGENCYKLRIGMLTAEYSGRAGANTDGAVHLKGCSDYFIGGLYGEQNERNIVLDDSLGIILNRGMFAALSGPDVETYLGQSFSVRGNSYISNRSVRTGEWLPDPNVFRNTTTGLHLSGTGAGQTIGLNGTQILSVQQPAVSDPPAATYSAPSGGATVDTQARSSLAQLAADIVDMRAQYNLALARLRTHGLIA